MRRRRDRTLEPGQGAKNCLEVPMESLHRLQYRPAPPTGSGLQSAKALLECIMVSRHAEHECVLAVASRLLEPAGPFLERLCGKPEAWAVPIGGEVTRDDEDIVRNSIREYIGWEEVVQQLKDQPLDETRSALLVAYREIAKKKIPEAVQQAYCIVVAVSDKNEAQDFKVSVDSRPLLQIINDDARSCIQDTAIRAEAMLPGCPYDLWREGETAHRVKDLVNAFAQRPQLPKMLNRKAILDTIIDGCVNGAFVLKLTRPDKSVRTFWRQTPDDVAIKDPSLEVVLPEAAELTEVSPGLLSPQILPSLWSGQPIVAKDVYDYFAGGKVVKVQREGYEEPVAIPKVAKAVIESAIETAVKEGRLWLISGPASVFAEEIPTGLLNSDAQLQPPPEAISPMAIVPDVLTDAWSNGTAQALSISVALSKKAGKPLPLAPV